MGTADTARPCARVSVFFVAASGTSMQVFAELFQLRA